MQNEETTYSTDIAQVGLIVRTGGLLCRLTRRSLSRVGGLITRGVGLRRMICSFAKGGGEPRREEAMESDGSTILLRGLKIA